MGRNRNAININRTPSAIQIAKLNICEKLRENSPPKESLDDNEGGEFVSPLLPVTILRALENPDSTVFVMLLMKLPEVLSAESTKGPSLPPMRPGLILL